MEARQCCNSWGCKELDTTDLLNWTELYWYSITPEATGTFLLDIILFVITHILVSLCFILLPFTNITSFFPLPVAGLWQSCNKQVYRHHFSHRIGSFHVSLSHFANFHNILNIFIMVYFYGNLWSAVFDVTMATISGVGACHELCPCKTEKLVNKCCVCSDCSNDWPFPLSPSPWPPCSLRHNNTEIRPIDSCTRATKCSSERKSQWGKFHCFILKNAMATPVFSNHCTHQTAALNTEARSSTNKQIMTCWRLVMVSIFL